MSQQGSASNGFAGGGVNHAVLVGTGTPAITSVGPGATGTVLIGNTAADPSFSAAPSVTSITIANAPSATTDGTNKAYVDAVATGLNIQAACYAGSTTALTVTYANGAAGVGATLTNAGAMAAFSIDSVSPPINSRILINNQASTLQNGIYTLTTVGSGAANWVLTRATDYDTPAEVQPGDLVVVSNGTVNANTSWIELDTVTTIGTDPIQFAQFTANPATFLKVANNLIDVASVSSSRSNLGLTNVATQNVTQHDVLVGGASNAITSVAPSATSGVPLISQGASSDPLFGTALVAGGGTGAVSFTAHSLLLGQTTSAITALGAATNGQIPIGSTGADPVLATITAGTNVSITNAAGSITINALTGSETVAYTAVNAAASPYTVLVADYYIGVTSSAGTVSILLPNAPSSGRVFIVKDSAGSAATHAITVTTVGGSINIDGATTYTMNTNYFSAQFIFNGTSYEVF